MYMYVYLMSVEITTVVYTVFMHVHLYVAEGHFCNITSWITIVLLLYCTCTQEVSKHYKVVVIIICPVSLSFQTSTLLISLVPSLVVSPVSLEVVGGVTVTEGEEVPTSRLEDLECISNFNYYYYFFFFLFIFLSSSLCIYVYIYVHHQFVPATVCTVCWAFLAQVCSSLSDNFIIKKRSQNVFIFSLSLCVM